MHVDDLLADDFQETPHWWTAAPRPEEQPDPLPAQTDVVIVGSGFTGLSAALTLARAGRGVHVLEADSPGHGASSRNAGFVGKTFKHSLATLVERHGREYAVRVYGELQDAFDCVTGLIAREQIQCHYVECGRYLAARSAEQYEAIARDLALKRELLGQDSEMIPRAGQHREIGSDRLHGGAVIPALGSLHPGLYHLGLLERVRAAGAAVIGHTPVTGIEREGVGFLVHTGRGSVRAGDVVVATNGYTGGVTPWLKRRLVPFHGFMIATERLEPGVLEQLFPHGRTVHDFNHNLVYMRRAPDEPRLLMGGRTGPPQANLRAKAAELKPLFDDIFPQLRGIKVSRVWSGQCAGTFDLYPHTGVYDGVHYALGYCFAGVPMGTYLGDKMAQRVLGRAQARTVFADRPFDAPFWYGGNPWFMPAVMRWYDWKDRTNAA